MADVFISYAGEDRSTAAALSLYFEASGWSVWWDRELVAGDEFASVIQRELDGASCVVVLWSHAASRSGWVTAEGQRAFDANKVVPVRLDDLTPPLPLSMIQAPALAGWDRTPSDPILAELGRAVVARLDPSRLVASATGALFRCVAVGEWGCAAGGHDGVVRVWSLGDGQILRELTGHADFATAVDWDGSGLLATGSTDRTARIWALAEERSVHTLVGHGGPVDDVSFAGDLLITVSSDRTVRSWSVQTGEPVASHTMPTPVLSCSSDQSGRVVAVGGADGDVTVFVDGAIESVIRGAHQGAVYTVRLTNDGRRVLTTGADQVARLWSTSTGAIVRTFRGHRGIVLAGALGDHVVVTGSGDGTARVWEQESGRQLDQMAGLIGGVAGVDVTPGGLIVATSGGGQLRATTWPRPSSAGPTALPGG